MRPQNILPTPGIPIKNNNHPVKQHQFCESNSSSSSDIESEPEKAKIKQEEKYKCSFKILILIAFKI
jgi:hypothetical protein